MVIIKSTVFETEYKVNFTTETGILFYAIREHGVWFLYYGQALLKRCKSIHECEHYIRHQLGNCILCAHPHENNDYIDAIFNPKR